MSGSATLTSITGYADFSKRQSQDIDASPAVGADNFTFNDVENFSQEVRLTSDDSFKFPWIVGANYGSTDIDWFQTIDLTDLAGIPTSNGAVQETETWALFGQMTFPLTEKCRLRGRPALHGGDARLDGRHVRRHVREPQRRARERRAPAVAAAAARRRPATRAARSTSRPPSTRSKVDYSAVLQLPAATKTPCTT